MTLNTALMQAGGAGARLGRPQRSGRMTMVPIEGRDLPGYTAPRTGLKVAQVKGYGNLELENPAGGEGLGIVPLHIGYIQKGAQNHAMCRAAFIAAGQKIMFEDACCVQAGQGGYLQESDQWFFILPLELRERALSLRGTNSYSKLWEDITAFNTRYGLPRRGHLEHLIGNHRSSLTQYRSRFERTSAQTGALFFMGGELVGVEIAPSVGYFEELFGPLVCFSYGAEAFYYERGGEVDETAGPPLTGASLAELSAALRRERDAEQAALEGATCALTAEQFGERVEEERFLDHSLVTLQGEAFCGQIIESETQGVVYASVFARRQRVLDIAAHAAVA